MNTSNHEHYCPPSYPFIAQQVVAAGLAIQPFPEITEEAGYRMPVIFTHAAHAEVVEWTRTDLAQDARGRLWEALMAAKPAVSRALLRPGASFRFEVTRIPNYAANGAESRAELPIPVELSIRMEAFDWELTPCLVVGLPSED